MTNLTHVGVASLLTCCFPMLFAPLFSVKEEEEREEEKVAGSPSSALLVTSNARGKKVRTSGASGMLNILAAILPSVVSNVISNVAITIPPPIPPCELAPGTGDKEVEVNSVPAMTLRTTLPGILHACFQIAVILNTNRTCIFARSELVAYILSDEARADTSAIVRGGMLSDFEVKLNDLDSTGFNGREEAWWNERKGREISPSVIGTSVAINKINKNSIGK